MQTGEASLSRRPTEHQLFASRKMEEFKEAKEIALMPLFQAFACGQEPWNYPAAGSGTCSVKTLR